MSCDKMAKRAIKSRINSPTAAMLRVDPAPKHSCFVLTCTIPNLTIATIFEYPISDDSMEDLRKRSDKSI
jgi:hypothetical protein